MVASKILCVYPLALLCSAFIALSSFVNANELQTSTICDSAALVAARETGVPLNVLRSISLTETGRRIDNLRRPWPWTVNMEGEGKWFDTIDTAYEYLKRNHDRGATSFDVGCFQINYKWHGHAFSSLQAMLDPITNARYAAKFLAELHAEFNNWSAAAGAYHSRTPKFARRYTLAFNRNRHALTEFLMPSNILNERGLVQSYQDEESRINGYPFLRTVQYVDGPSLIPFKSDSTSTPLVERSPRRLFEQ